ncbi:HK97 family phage prohead protease [uncultured Cohaesibacter sp.]|uniref:HK97 family phage prohead protease n=1 Tax=uncultured Cohaesibacter sp. TaxID=1002546 RepID=UPI0029313A74|nr:HK97 family phage prohead protease [uncultured Cohaesibacter sp.]
MLKSNNFQCSTKSRSLSETEKKAMPSALAKVAEDGLFEGYACLFGEEDLGHDVICAGAFASSLAQRGLGGIKLLYQHDPTQPIGHWLSIREDSKGLFVRGQLATDVAKAQEIHSMMKAGILDGLSIGFKTIKARKDAKTGIRHLLALDLWEISVVTFPMQPDARISSVKAASLSPPFSKRELERKLMQDAGLSRSQARALMARGLSGLTGKQDAVHVGPSNELARLRIMTRTMLQATRKGTGHLSK